MAQLTTGGPINLRILSGSESPEGVIQGYPGELYLQSVEGGSLVWQKISGQMTRDGWENVSKNIYNYDGLLTSDRTVDTDGKDIVFDNTVDGIKFGIFNDQLGYGNKTFSVTHESGDYVFFIMNKAEDTINDNDQNMIGCYNAILNESALIGVTRIGALGNAVFANLNYRNNVVDLEFAASASGFTFRSGGTHIFWIYPTGNINAPGLPSYVDNAAAVTAGLIPGFGLYVNSATGAIHRVI